MNLSLQHASILIIDDFQGMRTMLREIVKSMGVTMVDTASNGREALNHLKNKGYDIVICDYNLGFGQNGQQILEESRLSSYIGLSTVWVMVTAEKTTDMVMSAAEIKPDDYLLKPLNQSLLENRLKKLIAKKASFSAIETAIKENEYTKAIALCDQQLEAKPPNQQDLLRIKSDLLLSSGAYESARQVFQSVLTSRSVPWASTGLGKVLFNTGDLTAAKVIFLQVLEENRMYMEASDWLVKTLEALGEHRQAQQVLLDAVKLSPNSATRQQALASTAYRNGALDIAQAAFEKTLRISEFSPRKNPSTYTGLAKVLLDKNVPGEAIKVLERGKTDCKKSPAAVVQTAALESLVYQKMGQAEKARAALAEAQSMATQQAGNIGTDATIEMALALFQAGNKEQACALLQDLVKNNHENADLSRRIAAVFDSVQLGDEGRKLINASRQEVVNINNQGVTLAKAGEFAQGASLLRQALQTMPNNEVILMNLCGLLIGLLRKEGKSEPLVNEARNLLDRVRELNPSNRKRHDYALALGRMTSTH